MGISLGPMHFLLGCNIRFGKTLVLGRQDLRISSDKSEIEKIVRNLRPDINVSKFYGKKYADDFFKCLGVEDLIFLDASDYEGANIIHDFNLPIGKEFIGEFDTIIDGGTLEHVFHIPNAFANISGLLKVGGSFLSMSVANNWLGHGLYQFSPELMFRFCDSFGFEALKVQFYMRMDKEGFKIMPQEDPKNLGRRIEFNPTPQHRIDLMTHAKKIINVEPKYIYQSDYSTAWNDSCDK